MSDLTELHLWAIQGASGNALTDEEIQIILKDRQIVKRLEEDKDEIFIFVDSNGRMVTNEFRQMVYDIQKILGEIE